ncbi:MAG: hypothetical protein BWY72_02032 [Bacteroidetes bacterium ADurb.Bin416]|nr:MAG: hypothetical protein BWY72_02032 [Bacteroidetes bacterium ADurb.Bin416]
MDEQKAGLAAVELPGSGSPHEVRFFQVSLRRGFGQPGFQGPETAGILTTLELLRCGVKQAVLVPLGRGGLGGQVKETQDQTQANKEESVHTVAFKNAMIPFFIESNPKSSGEIVLRGWKKASETSSSAFKVLNPATLAVNNRSRVWMIMPEYR